MSTPASPDDEGGGRRRVGAEAAALDAVLARQRARDVLGPDPIEVQRTHALRFAEALDAEPARTLDLGSGGGVPGLVLAVEAWPAATMTLVDASQRRCTYLELCVGDLALAPRVRVLWGRAEEVGRDPGARGQHDAVVARSFGPPAVTAECAAPLLAVGGALVVSDPPGPPGVRWRDPALARLGLEVEASVVLGGATFTRLRQVEPCPDTYPRRPGVPSKRPLFRTD